jgi:hypothetical protein
LNDDFAGGRRAGGFWHRFDVLEVGFAVRNLLGCKSFVPDRPYNHGPFRCPRWGVGLVNEGSTFDGRFSSFIDQTEATNR